MSLFLAISAFSFVLINAACVVLVAAPFLHAFSESHFLLCVLPFAVHTFPISFYCCVFQLRARHDFLCVRVVAFSAACLILAVSVFPRVPNCLLWLVSAPSV